MMFSQIVRSALTRFLPGWIATMVAFPLIFKPHTFLELDRGFFKRFAAYTACALIGHVVTLLLLRPRLRADAEIVGRKSFVAGACAVGAVLIRSMTPHDRWTFLIGVGTYAAAGAITTLALYFPWLQSRAASIEDREASERMAALPMPRIDAVPLRYRDRVR